MALLASEMARVKAELGYNLLTSSAEPYIGVAAIFEQVIQPYLGAGASTTSATAVTAATVATPVTLTLASATGFAAGARIVIDVDDRQEIVTVQSISGATVVVSLLRAHTGTYPVTVEGGESIVRELLGNIRGVRARMAQAWGTGTLKQVDEVQFYQSKGTAFGALGEQLSAWREELASALGIVSMWSRKRGGAQTLSVY